MNILPDIDAVEEFVKDNKEMAEAFARIKSTIWKLEFARSDALVELRELKRGTK